mgnify:FL=1
MGELRQLFCTVIKGDEPLSIRWSLKGEDLGPGPDLTTSQLGPRTSMLMISSVNYRHSGSYTCTASNAAGTVEYTAQLNVHGKYVYYRYMKGTGNKVYLLYSKQLLLYI